MSLSMNPMKHISFIAVFALLIGCATPFRSGNASKIKEGMNKAQVVKIIGNPDGVEWKDGAEFLHYSHRENTQKKGWRKQPQHTQQTRNYVVMLVEGKVQSAKEVQSFNTP